MKTKLKEFDFYGATFKTRCGHKVRLTNWLENTILGYVIIELQNGEEFHHTMEWDHFGESINKHIRPTEHYYDIKVVN